MTPSAAVQTARAAAQLREAARDVARVAELRSRGAELVPGSAQQDGSAVVNPPPASLMRLVAARLAAAGLDVRQEDGDGGSQIAVPCDRGRLLAWAGDSGHAEWEWHPDGAADPKQVADLATVLLAGAGSNLSRRGDGYGRPGITFKGIVGTELAARGLDVRLDVYEDTRNYDVTAEVVAVNPSSAQAGTVYVTDSGTLTWSCDYWDQATAATPPPAAGRLDADPADAAKTISRTIIRAMAKSGLMPDSGAAGQAEAVHGHAEPE
jgi:hypothetical protein